MPDIKFSNQYPYTDFHELNLDWVIKEVKYWSTKVGKTIQSIDLTGTVGLVDTYTITYSDGTTSTFDVTNGNGITSIDLTSSAGNVDTYTISMTNGSTSTFTVTNSVVPFDVHRDVVDGVASAVPAGYAEISPNTDEFEIDGTPSTILQSSANTHAYYINTINRTGYIKGLRLAAGWTGTQFSVYHTDSNNNILDALESFTPVIVSGQFDLPQLIAANVGDKLLIRTIDGKCRYTTGAAIYPDFNTQNQTMSATSTVIVEAAIIMNGADITFDGRRMHSLTNSAASAVRAGYAELQDTGTSYTIPHKLAGVSSVAVSYSAYYINTITCPGKLTGIILTPSWTATTFSIYRFDQSDVLIESQENFSPTITDYAFSLPFPMNVLPGDKILIRAITGKIHYNALSGNIFPEYQIASQTVIYSPVVVDAQLVISDVDVVFTINDLGTIMPDDFQLPKMYPGNDEYTLIGRWFDITVGGNAYKATNTDGASILLRVSGTSTLTVQFNTITTPNYMPYFAYSIDGGAFTRQLINNTSINIGDTDEHVVWIVVDGMGEQDPTNTKWTGGVGLYLVSISGGTRTNLIPQSRQIMFFGDSIVEGINALGTGANANVNSATNSFAFNLTRKLNSIPLMAGYGASGMVTNGSFHKCIDAVDYNISGVPVNEMQPDIILIEHGTNDYSRIITPGSGITEADYIAAYKDVIERLNVKYPGTPIMCMVPFNQNLANAVANAAADYSNAFLVATAGINPATTDGTHLSAAGAVTAAEALTEKLIGIMGKAFFI